MNNNPEPFNQDGIMNRLVTTTLTAALLLGGAFLAFPQASNAVEVMSTPTGVLVYDKAKVQDGYTLVSPMIGTSTYLLDMEGNIVHEWKTAGRPGLYAELLPNGHLLRGLRYDNKVPFGGMTGCLQEIDWDGKVVWEHKIYDDKHLSHHAFDRMPNGNTLIVAWEHKTYDEAIAKGRKPGTLPKPGTDTGHKPNYDGLWADYIVEVDPHGNEVWSWHAWDHIGTGKDQFDINYRLRIKNYYGDSDWMHINSVRYNPETNQVLISSRNFSEVFIVNHDKSGKVVWRFGNPSNHGEGPLPGFCDDGSQILFGNHDATWLENGKIGLFDNGWLRPQGNRSRALVVDIKASSIEWEYVAKNPNSFSSAYQGSTQHLPNGNVLITSTATGHIFEVTKDKEVVWEYVSPFVRMGDVRPMLSEADAIADPSGLEDINAMFNMVHRAFRYTADYPGLKGKDLSHKIAVFPDAPKWYEIFDNAFLYKTTLKKK